MWVKGCLGAVPCCGIPCPEDPVTVWYYRIEFIQGKARGVKRVVDRERGGRERGGGEEKRQAMSIWKERGREMGRDGEGTKGQN